MMPDPNSIVIHSPDHVEQNFESDDIQIHKPVAAASGLSVEKAILAQMILESNRSPAPASNHERDFAKWPLSDLIQYIIRSHHDYIREEMPRLHALTERVLATRKWLNPELIELASNLRRLSGDLTFHMSHCENKVFPYILELERVANTETRLGSSSSAQAESPIEEVMVGHAPAFERLRQIESDTGGFMPPEDATPDMISLYEGLRELARRRSNHIQLEGYILFPRAMAMEKRTLAA